MYVVRVCDLKFRVRGTDTLLFLSSEQYEPDLVNDREIQVTIWDSQHYLLVVSCPIVSLVLTPSSCHPFSQPQRSSTPEPTARHHDDY